MMQLHYHANKSFQLHIFMAQKLSRQHIGVVARTVNDINLLACLVTAKVVRCAPEAEWLPNNYDK
jgi:hypothetical protein